MGKKERGVDGEFLELVHEKLFVFNQNCVFLVKKLDFRVTLFVNKTVTVDLNFFLTL